MDGWEGGEAMQLEFGEAAGASSSGQQQSRMSDEDKAWFTDMIKEAVGGVTTRLDGIEKIVGKFEGVTHALSQRCDRLDESVKQLKSDQEKGEKGANDKVAKLHVALKGVKEQASQVSKEQALVVNDVKVMQRECEAMRMQLEGKIQHLGAEMEKTRASLALLEMRPTAQVGPEVLQAAVKQAVDAMQTGPSFAQVVFSGSQAPPTPSTSDTVGERLGRELGQEGLKLKLEGMVEQKQGQSEVELCEAAGRVLSTMVGGSAPMVVIRAKWLRAMKAGQVPRLMITMQSLPMIMAVLQLKGRPGGRPSKLGQGQRILQEFGPVERKVRDVLYKELPGVQEAAGGGGEGLGGTGMHFCERGATASVGGGQGGGPRRDHEGA